MNITKSDYGKEIGKIAQDVYRLSKGNSDKYDLHLDAILMKHKWYKNREGYALVLANSDSDNTVFELKLLKALVNDGDISCIDDFYYYASYYAMYKDVHIQLEQMKDVEQDA